MADQIFYLAPVPPPHPDHREHAERRAQRTSGNARHCDRGKVRAVCRKMNDCGAPGDVERTCDQGAVGNKQRTPIDRNRAGNVRIVRHLDDGAEFVPNYPLDRIWGWHDGYFGMVEADELQFMDHIMQFILIIE
jgi:hypothetical protein